MTKIKQPLVSIIIPTYNTARYLEEAVNSALGQTYKNKEIIVVDDGSTDNTREILDVYIRKGVIKYIYQKNKGLAGARNTGIMSARGEYVALLDADDLFKLDKVEKQLRYLNNCPDCDFCYCDVLLFQDNRPNKFFRYDYKYYSGSIFKYLLRQNFINPSTLFFHRKNIIDKFGLFNESLRRVEDLEYYLRVSLAGAKFCFLDEPLFLSRVRKNGNLQSDQAFVQETTLNVLKNIGERLTFSEREIYGLDEAINSRKVKLSLAYLASGNRRLGRKTILEVDHMYILKFLVLLLSFISISLISFLVDKLTILRRRILFKRSI